MANLIGRTLSEVWRRNKSDLAVNYLQVPIGVVALIGITWGVNLVILKLPFEFPAPVVTMLLLFGIILIVHAISSMSAFDNGDESEPRLPMRWFMRIMGPSLSWLLRYMPAFFTPSFILVPGKEALSAKTIGLIIAWFIPSFILAFLVCVYLCKLYRLLPWFSIPTPPNSEADDEEKQSDVQQVISTSKEQQDDKSSSKEGTIRAGSSSVMQSNYPTSVNVADDKDDITRVNTRLESSDSEKKVEPALPSPTVSAEPRHIIIATKLQPWVDPFIYSLLGIFGLFFFYFNPTNGVARTLPLFLAINSLAYLFSVRVVPDKFKAVLHPILVTSVIACLLIWAFGATLRWPIVHTLNRYSTSTSYTELFRPDAWNDGRLGPGAGDLLTSILNAGIVALALPLYNYRHDLRRYFSFMMLVILPNIALSILFWPFIPGQRVMGMDWETAVTFGGRFMSTPLAIEYVKAADGNEGLTVVLVVVTGIVIVLTKDHLFRFLRVAPEDSLTIGLTVGILGGAIGTSSLMKTNPRAMATATVGFVGYGLIMLCLIAVVPVSEFVKTIAGR